MLAPISWLKDYVDINVSPEVLAKKLVAIGFEVEEIMDGDVICNVITGGELSDRKSMSLDVPVIAACTASIISPVSR